MRDHTKLRAFELADKTVLAVYELTRSFPKEEIYGLTSQMRRGAVSVPSNIVEGCSRNSHGEYLRFLEIAYSAWRELNYHLDLSIRLGFVSIEQAGACSSLAKETGAVLGSLLRSLRKTQSSPPRPET